MMTRWNFFLVSRGLPGKVQPDRFSFFVYTYMYVSCYLASVTTKPHEVLATREAREALPAMLARFRKDGTDAEPVVIGARRRPEAVVLSYERYLQLAGGRERVAAALDRQTRETTSTMDADAALELANSELHAMRAERPAQSP